MALGDQADMQARLKGLLPASWFVGATPVLDSALAGFAAPLAWAYSLYAYVLRQSRIATSTGVWLDRSAWDFFGARFRRRLAEPDAAFLARILPEILRERSTRKGVIQAVTDLTGSAPAMIEFTSPLDNGSLGGPYIGLGVAGHLGSVKMPNQAFLTAYRPATSGIPNVPGLGITATAVGSVLAGLGRTGRLSGVSEIVGPVTDADIYRTVAETQAAGVIVWTAIQNAPPALGNH